jgi:hypothetical protein
MFATNQTKEIGFAQSATQSVPDTQPLDRNCAMARVSNDKRKMYVHVESQIVYEQYVSENSDHKMQNRQLKKDESRT